MTGLRVSNLPAGVTVPDLWALFRPFGRVAWVSVGPADVAPATARVDLASGSRDAVAALDGSTYRGVSISVRRARRGA